MVMRYGIMNDGAVLPARYLLLADAVAIAIAVLLIHEAVGFAGVGILPLITVPTFILISSFGLWMWANGMGANLISSPGWNSLDDGLKTRGVSIMGMHIALGMAFVSSAIPFVVIPVWGIAAFLVLLFTGMGITFAGVIRILSLSRNSARTSVPKSPMTVWITVFLVLFGIVAVPVLALDTFGTAGVEVGLGETSMSIKAPLVDRTIDYADIDKVELDDAFSIGGRISGYGGLSMNTGTFKNSEYGQYTLASYTTCDTFIKITMKSGSHIVINQKDAESTLTLYNDISGRV